MCCCLKYIPIYFWVANPTPEYGNMDVIDNINKWRPWNRTVIQVDWNNKAVNKLFISNDVFNKSWDLLKSPNSL